VMREGCFRRKLVSTIKGVFFSISDLFSVPIGVVLGFKKFAWGLTHKKNV
jgi:hypothetical protein